MDKTSQLDRMSSQKQAHGKLGQLAADMKITKFCERKSNNTIFENPVLDNGFIDGNFVTGQLFAIYDQQTRTMQRFTCLDRKVFERIRTSRLDP